MLQTVSSSRTLSSFLRDDASCGIDWLNNKRAKQKDNQNWQPRKDHHIKHLSVTGKLFFVSSVTQSICRPFLTRQIGPVLHCTTVVQTDSKGWVKVPVCINWSKISKYIVFLLKYFICVSCGDSQLRPLWEMWSMMVLLCSLSVSIKASFGTDSSGLMSQSGPN